MLRSITSGRVVVISPHLDDAVLSLGAGIARLARRGVQVDVLSVFGCDPSSTRAPSGWDSRAGFANEGAAAAARREEDRVACHMVGANPSVLGFRGGSYGGPGDAEPLWHAIAEVVGGADVVLMPGFPLTNADHFWLHMLLVEKPPPSERLGLYAEQPYRYAARREQPMTTFESPIDGPRWASTGYSLRELRLKKRAILAYRSQIPLLGFTARRHRKLNRMLLHEALHRGEVTAELRATKA
jgi:LmbE family N-acetylglucosaminyl deacetylase